ncbi:MAG: hypothetical protein ACQGVC_25275 [Myxococcota bacterium]
MRHIATLVLGLALLLPAAAADARPQGSSECRHLTTQIEFFAMRLGRARQLNNDVWEARLENHLDRLIDKRAARCEGYSDSDQAWEAIEKLVELAAKGAVTFFTMGAF